jgi:hypothetical protein
MGCIVAQTANNVKWACQNGNKMLQFSNENGLF